MRVCVCIFFSIFCSKVVYLKKKSGIKPKKKEYILFLPFLLFGFSHTCERTFRSEKSHVEDTSLLTAYDYKTDFTGKILSLVTRKAVEKAIK